MKVSRAMKHLQLLTDRGFEKDEEQKDILDYGIEENPVQFSDGHPTDKYHFIAEMDRWVHIRGFPMRGAGKSIPG